MREYMIVAVIVLIVYIATISSKRIEVMNDFFNDYDLVGLLLTGLSIALLWVIILPAAAIFGIAWWIGSKFRPKE